MKMLCCFVSCLQSWSRLHPECEYIFQLEKEERQCLQYIAELGNRSTEGAFPFFFLHNIEPVAISSAHEFKNDTLLLER